MILLPIIIKSDIYLLKCEYKLDFINLAPHIKTDFHRNTTIINLKTSFFGLIILLKEDIFFLIELK